MISYQFVFAIIVINLFVAVILAGHEESSRLDEANLSDYDLEMFKKHWAQFDPDARGLIKINQLIRFLAKIRLPFDVEGNFHNLIGKMYLPIITLRELETTTENKKMTEEKWVINKYFLFQDVMSAITHISTEKNIREKELRKMNMKNQLCMEIENARYK